MILLEKMFIFLAMLDRVPTWYILGFGFFLF